MKKLFFLMITFMFVGTFMFGQTVTLTTEDLSKLDPATRSKIEQINTINQMNSTIETVGKYAGLGKEIGTAMNESLVAITTTAADFAKTDLGKFTMFLVAYKVIGSDMLQLIIGLLWIIIIILISMYIYRSNSNRRVLMNKNWNSEGKGWDKKYTIIDSDTDYKTAAIVIFCIGMIVAIFIILA